MAPGSVCRDPGLELVYFACCLNDLSLLPLKEVLSKCIVYLRSHSCLRIVNGKCIQNFRLFNELLFKLCVVLFSFLNNPR